MDTGTSTVSLEQAGRTSPPTCRTSSSACKARGTRPVDRGQLRAVDVRYRLRDGVLVASASPHEHFAIWTCESRADLERRVLNACVQDLRAGEARNIEL